ncbi:MULTISPECIES: phosphoadenylyl-sulfate reductase [unclassified Novosphingobium]|uniref:phosphoadenylyl-sulfate reductase n=1 Tax=unclassified Novosphingobium TaxID=2644732 RepID=UPI000ED2096B|nr:MULTISPECIES: phosphoadenylyl-sulfate reductase [unclassified Novosphingobium]HCF24528.1 phosphoadenylyl-sulfate reductase [Novosphingobium sp.]HQV03342.1 phosphoadenylyl-sulfate reductase [Novosphingobium sp.]
MGEAARRIDRLDTAARFTAAEVEALNARFANVPTKHMLAAVLSEGLAGRIAAVSSFGAESAVLLHLIASVDRSVPVLFLETGKHFPETLAYRDEITRRLGLTNLINLTPDPQLLAKRDETGLRWSYDPDGCCEIRKVLPLARALEDFDASFTGRKGFQSATRAGLPRFELDLTDVQGRLKINPLADWSSDQIQSYFAATGLPPHPLVAQGYPSIGCSPCTTMVAPGEDPRSGRWKGWDKTECGIHVDGAVEELPPGYEPYL